MRPSRRVLATRLRGQKKTGFPSHFFFGPLRERRATRRVERRRDSTQSQRSSHKRGDSISGGSGVDFVKAGQPGQPGGRHSGRNFSAGDLTQRRRRAAAAARGPGSRDSSAAARSGGATRGSTAARGPDGHSLRLRHGPAAATRAHGKRRGARRRKRTGGPGDDYLRSSADRRRATARRGLINHVVLNGEADI